MSIRQCLSDRVREGRVFEVVPLLPSPKGRPRSVWAESFVFEQLSPDTAAEQYSRESGRMRRKLEGIVSGKRVVVGNRRDKTCDMKRLDPASNEVWEVRECDDPSVRIFFRFIERDCIAATNVRFVSDLFAIQWIRKGLEFWPIWWAEIQRCKSVWRGLFLTYPPHSREHLDDYISNAVGSGSF